MLTNNLITQPDHPFLSFLSEELVARCYPGSGWTFSKVLDRFRDHPTSFMLTSPHHDAFGLWERITPITYLLECHALDPEISPQVLIELFSEGNDIMGTFTEDANLLAWAYKPRCPSRLDAFAAIADWWHLQGAYLLDESLSGRAGLLRLGEVGDDVVNTVLPQAVSTFNWAPPATLLEKRNCALYRKPYTSSLVAS